MKFQLGEIRQMKEPLSALIDKDVPIKTAWKLNKLVRVLDKELSEIDEFRKSLINKLNPDGVPDENGSVQVPKEKLDQFFTEFNELLMTETDIEFEVIEIDTLGDINISAKDLLLLDKIFV